MTTTMTDLQTGRTFVFNEALPGRDAYDEALAQGFVGTRAAWLAHLRGFVFDPASAGWESDRAYVANAAVRHAHKLWVAIVPNTAVTPGTDPDVWLLLLDGASAQDLTDAVAAALAHEGAAGAAAADAEAKRAAAALILTQTQSAAQALSPVDALHPVSHPIPAGWWDTGDRLLSGVSERAIISNWQETSLLPTALYRADDPASLFSDTAGTTPVAIGGQIARAADTSGNSNPQTQANAGQRPLRGTMPVTGARNLCPISEPTVAQLSGSGAGVTNAAPFGVFARSIQIPAGATTQNSYVSSSSEAGRAAVISMHVLMDDGLAPTFGSATSSNSANDFAINLRNTVVNPLTYTVTPVGGGIYRVSAAGVTGTNASNSGAIRFSSNSGRGFRVTGFQIEYGGVGTPYQTAVSALEVYEAGVANVDFAQFDAFDDSLAGPVAGGAGAVVVAGPGGIYAGPATIAPGGTLTIGGAGSALSINGAPTGILRAVGGPRITSPRVYTWNAMLTMPDGEQLLRLEQRNKARGGLGLLEEGPELLTLGAMIGGAGWDLAGGVWTKTAGAASVLAETLTPVAGGAYLLVVTATRSAGGLTPRFTGGVTVNWPTITAAGTPRGVVLSVTDNASFELSADAAFAGTVTAISLKRLIPRE